MAQTLFSLGLPTTSSPWSYQHSLGISVKDVESWWKNTYPGVKQDLQNLQAGGLGPGNVPAKPPVVTPPPQTMASDGTMILVSVLVVGGLLGGYYYWKKQQKGKRA